jgi:NADPH-dependent F420 reductase
MQVTIIGTGNMARGIGTRLLAGGHSVTFIGHEANKAEDLVAELNDAVRSQGMKGSAAVGTQLTGDIVVLAVPWTAAIPIVQQYGNQLGGKIIVDITNPIDFNTMEPATAPGSSGAEEIAKAAPPTAKVVKAFNTTFAGTLVAGQAGGQPIDVFIAGDDEQANTTLAQLARDGGLNPIIVGELIRARQLESLGLLSIALQFSLSTDFQTGWKLLLPMQA